MSELTNPYVGLRPFDSHESLLFYGRRQQIPDLLQKLYDTRFLAVVGSSGCGKSSLIRAGLIPHLKAGFLVADREQWRIVVMKPGNRPLYHLAEAIDKTVFDTPDPAEHQRFYDHIQAAGIRAVMERLFLFFHETDANILILVDQFEEIFRFARTKSHDEAADFVSIMLALCQTKDLPVYTVMTMRSDFIGDCDTFYKLPEAMNQSQYLVPRMTREQRRQAIEGPASICGVNMPEHLVQQLLNDSSNNPDQLPVLQHALMRTWDKWQNDQDSQLPEIKHYESIGGINLALSRHADEIFFSLPESQQRIAERIFKALTTQDAEGRGIRRNTAFQDLCNIADASAETVVSILDRFRHPTCSFLMPPSSEKLSENIEIDIAHESLMRVWKRLDQWVSDEAASAKRYIRLAETAALNQKNEADFITDPELSIAESWQKENAPNASWAARYHDGFDQTIGFINQSIAVRKEKKEKAQKDARNKNIFRFVVIAMFVLLGLSIFVGVQYRKVSIAWEIAENARQSEANARQVAENALKEAEKERQEADHQRKLAVEQKQIAETQRNKVEKQLKEILQLKDTLNPLAAKQGRLYVKAMPEDATIVIDTINKPYSDGIKLDAGTYTIHVRHKDYYDRQIKVQIKAGKEKQVPMVTLKPLPGNIRVSVSPLDAIIYLNSNIKGKGKVFVDHLSPGTYHIRLQKEGYAPFEKEFHLGANQTVEIEERLIQYARLTVQPKPSDATVKIMNIRPVYEPGMYLLPGSYEIFVSQKGFHDFETTVTLDEGMEKSLPVALKPIQKEPVKEFTNQFGMTFVYIKPGSFLMGSPKNERGRESDEIQHTVNLTKGFYMQTTEMTQGQWMAVMGENPSSFKTCGKDCPVESVSWNDVQQFIDKLNQKKQTIIYRLPTEAEWEYTARAGSTSAFANGDISETGCGKDPNLTVMGWYCGNSCVDHEGGSACSWCVNSCKAGTHPVAKKQPNAWGLYDMHGNVWEWCADGYADYPQSSVSDPTGPDSGGLRVVRGGSWYNYARGCRSANRSRILPGYRFNYLGLRLAAFQVQQVDDGKRNKQKVKKKK
jgi:formylglycine-generating enzyme required for sulfatase activity/energy-coupling factor transporter ATP-binding protein EcfA2/Tfp pilus assembly protein PilX